MRIRSLTTLVAAVCLTTVASAQDQGNRYRAGHFMHGPAFDEGPREKPPTLDGIGRTHFAITTRSPEVQAWFDQGHTLLHSYWFYEAERAFRWCLKLEPGNAMASWGMARASGNRERSTSMAPPSGPPTPHPLLDACDTSCKIVSLDEFRGKNVLLVFYLGDTCVHCLTQLKQIGERKDEFARLDMVLLAVSSDAPEVNAKSQDGFPWRLLSYPSMTNAKRFKSFDDFEEMPIHSTLLVDRQGRIHGGRHGGAPFDDVKFLQAQLRRMNERQAMTPPTASR